MDRRRARRPRPGRKGSSKLVTCITVVVVGLNCVLFLVILQLHTFKDDTKGAREQPPPPLPLLPDLRVLPEDNDPLRVLPPRRQPPAPTASKPPPPAIANAPAQPPVASRLRKRDGDSISAPKPAVAASNSVKEAAAAKVNGKATSSAEPDATGAAELASATVSNPPRVLVASDWASWAAEGQTHARS